MTEPPASARGFTGEGAAQGGVSFRVWTVMNATSGGGRPTQNESEGLKRIKAAPTQVVKKVEAEA